MMARYYIDVKKKRGCLGSCVYWTLFVCFLPITLPVWLVKQIIKTRSPQRPPESIYKPNGVDIDWNVVQFKMDHPDIARNQTNIADAKSTIAVTWKLPVFFSWYNTIQESYSKIATHAKYADYAAEGWQKELQVYPQKLSGVVDRAIAEAQKLKTTRGQLNRLNLYLEELNGATVYDEETGNAIEQQRMRLQELRDECILNTNNGQ